MKNLLLTATAVAALAASSSAFAQDDNWSGLYVGATVGALNQPGDNDERLDFDRNLNGQFNDQVRTSLGDNAFGPGFCGGSANGLANTGCLSDDESFDVSLRGGYDWQTGGFVYGIVGEIGAVDATDNVSGFSTTPASYTFTRDAKWLAAIRARAGYAVGPYLVYGTGGFAYGDVDHRFATSNSANVFTPRKDDTLSGYQYGLGAERKWNDNWSLGLEYLVTSLKDDDYVVRVSQGTAPATNPFVLAPDTTGTDIRRSHSKFAFDSIRLSLNYRFNK